MATAIYLPIALPLLTAALLAAVGRKLPRPLLDGAALSAALAVFGLGVVLLVGSRGHDVAVTAGGWGNVGGHPVGIALVADPVSAGLVALTGLITAFVSVYTWRYFEEVDAVWQALLLIFLAGLAGLALVGDVFSLFVTLELVSVVGFVLTGYRVEAERSLQGALSFAVASTVGGVLSLVGVALIYARTGQLGLAPVGRALAAGPHDALVPVSLALLLTGFLVKAAAVPFHFWTAAAEMVAPTPVCILFSGVMVTSGVYAIARIYHIAYQPALSTAVVRPTFLAVAAITALVGALMSVAQRHFKRMLAFSTIAHVGIMLVGVALLGSAGATGTVIYAVGHAGAKGALFCVAGVLLSRFDTVDEGQLHGRGRPLRSTAAVAVLAGLALAGIPPFGTGLGKVVTEDAARQAGMPWLVAVLVIAAALTGAAVLRFSLRCFLGWGRPAHDQGIAGRPNEEPEPDPAGRLLVAAWLLLALSLAAGLAGTGWAALAGSSVTDGGVYRSAVLTGAEVARHATAPAGWSWAGLPLALAPALLAGLFTTLWLRPPPRLDPAHLVLTALTPLRRWHSGRVGDETTWLLAGVVAIGLALLIASR